MIPELRRVRSNDDSLRQLQDGVDFVLRAISTKEILDGVLIQDISITSGTAKIVDHKLGRVPLGYIVVSRNANSNIWTSTSSVPSSVLKLNASANVTINLWVF